MRRRIIKWKRGYRKWRSQKQWKRIT